MRELRAISFTERELSAALVEFSGKLRRPLPPGTLLDTRLNSGPPVSADLPVQDDYGMVKNISYSETEIAAALVQYCMNRKVRMPAKAEKTLQVIGGTPTLLIWLRPAEARPLGKGRMVPPSRR